MWCHWNFIVDTVLLTQGVGVVSLKLNCWHFIVDNLLFSLYCWHNVQRCGVPETQINWLINDGGALASTSTSAIDHTSKYKIHNRNTKKIKRNTKHKSLKLKLTGWSTMVGLSLYLYFGHWSYQNTKYTIEIQTKDKEKYRKQKFGALNCTTRVVVYYFNHR